MTTTPAERHEAATGHTVDEDLFTDAYDQVIYVATCRDCPWSS